MNDQWLTMVTAVAAIFTIALIGALARRAEWLTEESDQTLLNLVIRVLFPALIFEKVVGNRLLRAPENLYLPPLVGFASIALGFAVAGLVAKVAHRPLGLKTPAQRRTFTLCVGVFNYSYVPTPLAEQLFPGTGTVGVLFVYNIGVEIAMWTLGILVISGGLGKGWWRRLLNMPTLAILLALCLNLTGLHRYIPGFLLRTLAMLGQCAIPTALLLIGATIADHVKDARLTQAASVMSGACILRLGLLPLLFLMMVWALPASPELKRVVALEAAMPAAVFPIVLARRYDGDAPTAIRIVIGTSLVSLITMPLWLSAGLKLVGAS